jgi:hypothetical protein
MEIGGLREATLEYVTADLLEILANSLHFQHNETWFNENAQILISSMFMPWSNFCMNGRFRENRRRARSAFHVKFGVCPHRRYIYIYIYIYIHIYTFFSHGVRLSPPGTAATVWLTIPDPDDDDEGKKIGGMRIGKGNRSTRRKPALVSLCPPQIPHNLTRSRTRAAVVGSRRLTA